MIIPETEITWEEYEQAFFAYVACLDEHGIPRGEPELFERRRPPIWRISIGPVHEGQREEAHQISDDCYFELLAPSEGAWEIQEGPTQAERQAQLQEVVECVNERAGSEIPDYTTLNDMARSDQLSAEEDRARRACVLWITRGDDSLLD